MKKTLSVSPSKAELIWGAIYILLDLTILPFIMVEVNYVLGEPLSPTKMNIILFIANFGITTLIFRKFIGKTLRDALHHLPEILFAAVRGFLIYWAGNLLVSMLVLQLNPDFMNVNDANIDAMVQTDFLPIAVCSIFFVPITEELLYRGVLFAGFYKRSPFQAFLFSAIVFSAIHVIGYIPDYSWDTLLLCFIQYIPASIALGWAYDRSGSILSPIAIHMAINAIGMSAMR